MALITIFSSTKPFLDPFIATIQRNAIQSWIELGSEVSVSLIGNEPGMAEVAKELGVRHVTEVECNRWGTPLVRSIFEGARRTSDTPLMAIVNTDMLLMPDFLRAAKVVSSKSPHFLIIGRRWGLNIDAPLDFELGWQARLRSQVKAEGQLHPIFSIDYFVFPRDQYQQMPDFVIGRPQWDNWMIYHAIQKDWLVVDATPSVLVVHQNHDYRHLPGGKPPHGLEEGKRNRELAGGLQTRYLILDAQVQLVGDELQRPPMTLERILRRIERRLMSMADRRLANRVLRHIRRWRKSFGDPLPSDGMHWGARLED